MIGTILGSILTVINILLQAFTVSMGFILLTVGIILYMARISSVDRLGLWSYIMNYTASDGDSSDLEDFERRSIA